MRKMQASQLELMSSDREDILRYLKQLVLEALQDVSTRVYLFGSWARHQEKRTSDIDIAIDPDDTIPNEKWIELRERLEESTIPYRVDLVDLTHADSNIKQKVEKKGILWKG